MDWIRLALLLFPTLLIAAGTIDVLLHRIPSGITLLLVLAFPLLAVCSGMAPWVMAGHALVFICFLGAGLLLFSLNVWGGGDAKLLAASGLWLGFPGCIYFLGFAALIGGVLALAVGMTFLLNEEVRLNRQGLARFMPVFKPSLPYGYALSAGAILAIPWSWWMTAAAGQG